MMSKLLEWDRQLFLWLNEHHTPWLDPIIFFLTNTIAWAPLFAWLLFLLVRQHGRSSWIYILAIAVTIALADQVTSSLMKPYFMRFRPSHEPELAGLVHTVNKYKGGKFGFASSHAANTFGAAAFLFLALRRSFRYMGLLFLWAGFVCYTRVYLGVHYPGDLLVGGLIGACIGWGAYKAAYKVERKLAGQSANGAETQRFNQR